jgi:uncharacterized protein YbaR (Trm112 family)
MRAVTKVITFGSILAIAAVVYAGEGFSMKCKAKTCGYETTVTFGGGMAFSQLTGYCVKCKKFVSLQWTLEGSPLLDPNAKKIPQPKPLGEIWDSQSGRKLTIFACPHCTGPFAEIKKQEELKHCPSCNKPEFGIDETKPMMAID